MQVGFVGTGNMGAPMALNLVKAGHDVTVFDARPEATVELERLGARRASDLPGVARACRVVFTSLPDDAVVDTVVLGAGGLLMGSRSGDVVFDLSTVRPDGTRRRAAAAAERGVHVVDAPVSGSVSGAVAGTLAVMVGATAEFAAPWDALFRAIGRSVFYLGSVGTGNTLKLLNNYVALGNQAVLAEALALADRLGVSRRTVADVLRRSSGASFILERKSEALAARDYRAGFFVDLALKDLTLALELAAAAGAATAVGAEARRLYAEASAAGLGRLDSSGVTALIEPPA